LIRVPLAVMSPEPVMRSARRVDEPGGVKSDPLFSRMEPELEELNIPVHCSRAPLPTVIEPRVTRVPERSDKDERGWSEMSLPGPKVRLRSSWIVAAALAGNVKRLKNVPMNASLEPAPPSSTPWESEIVARRGTSEGLGGADRQS
jgi:hypothetical protein